jgi:hypothetical protein
MLRDPFENDRIEKRVRGAFEYHIRTACDRRRTSRNLRRTMGFFEDKKRHEDPLAKLGIVVSSFGSFVGRESHVGRGSPDPALPTTEGLRPTNPPHPAVDRDRGPSKRTHPTTEGLPTNSKPRDDFTRQMSERTSARLAPSKTQ